MNIVILSGRLAADPVMKANRNGSTKVLATIITEMPYKARNGKPATKKVQVQQYIDKDSTNTWLSLGEGDAIECQGTVDTDSWDDAATGKKVYRSNVIEVGNPQYKESKQVREQRAAAKRAEREGGDKAVQAAEASFAEDDVVLDED